MSKEKLKNKNHTSHFALHTSSKGITLIALIITVIVMLVLAGVTIKLTTDIFDTAKSAAKESEKHAIYDQILAEMELTNNGKIDVAKTYNRVKTALTLDGKTVATIEPATEARNTAETTKIVFTVQGKYGTYKYEITELEIKQLGEVSGEVSGDGSGETGEGTGGGNVGENGELEDEEPVVVPDGYATTLEGLGTGVSLVQYARLPENLKKEVENGKITAVIEETVNGEKIRAAIPVGLTVSTTDGEDTISGGLVVKDESQNEFVWIPVPEINDMVMCQSAEMNGTGRCTLELQGETLTCTKHNSTALAGRLYATTTGGFFNANLTGQTYNATSGVREPAKLTGTYTITPVIATTSTPGETGGEFAYDSQKMFTYFGGGTYSDTMYQDEFNEMATSVAKYGGFYVGRYETGGFNETTVVSKADRGMNSAGGDINETTWYKMYQMQKDFKRGSVILGSSMIWGCQYDQVMKFVDGKTDGIGNTFSVNKYDSNRRSSNSTTGTGNVPADFVTNIYDLEGNMFEWTLEANSTSGRVCRGGSYINTISASSRYDRSPDFSSYIYRVSPHTLYKITKLFYIMKNFYKEIYNIYEKSQLRYNNWVFLEFSKVKFRMQTLDKQEITVIGYNDIADFALKNLKDNKKIFINGKINTKMEIEIKKYANFFNC